MSNFRKAKVLLTAAYKNGDILRQDYQVPARIEIREIPSISKFKELSLRLVIATEDAEELLEGIALGTTSLTIEQMLSPLERATKAT